MGARPKQFATLTRKELDEQVKSFLKKGGKIEKVDSGVTGVEPNKKGPRHIVITPKK